VAPNGPSILVIDDDPSMLKMVAAVLRGGGYEVRIASTAEQALMMLQTLQPAAILVDLQLPGLHGIEFTRHVRENPATRNTVILAMTAFAGAGVVKASGEAGCDGFLRKPFDPQTLIGLVRARLKGEPAAPSADLLPAVASTFLEHSGEECRALLNDLKIRFPDAAAGRRLSQIGKEAREFGFESISERTKKATSLIDALWRDPEGLREALSALCAEFERLQGAGGTKTASAIAGAARGARGPARILVIDDDADIIRLVKALVEKAGMLCDAAGDGTEAIRKIEEFQPHLILIDIHLPGGDGFGILKAARDKFPHVRTVLLTGSQEESHIRRGFESGVDDYVSKPIKVAEFMARVKRLLPKDEPQT
jgi:CheY-like chemotaxis protein